MFRRRRHPFHLPRPRPPRRLRRSLRLPGGIAPSLEGFPLRRPRHARRSASGSVRGYRRQLPRRARALADADALRAGGIGRVGGELRRKRSSGGNGEIETEIGVAGVGDRDNISFRHHRSDHGNVSKRLHH